MSESTVLIESTSFRLFISREASQFRAFWFCPFSDCYGSFRSDRLVKTREEAVRLATAAAERHHQECHCSTIDWLHPAISEEDAGRLRIHG